jgi:LysM repeat protein
MRVRTWSACAALAWGIIVLIMTAAGPIGTPRPTQASTRIASSTSSTSTTSSRSNTIVLVTLDTSVTSTPAGNRNRTSTPAGYVVQPGDTLSGIAAALGTPGGWPALYAANRREIGPNPSLVRPGTFLALPGRVTPDRYTIAAGDTLSGIAAAVGTPGGWPALYAANRGTIGPDPNAIRAGTVLAIPRPTPPAAPASAPGSPRPSTTAPPTAKAQAPSGAHQKHRPARRPAQTEPPGPAGLPRWLEVVLVAAGLLIATAFLTEPVLAIARRRRAARLDPADAADAADAHIVLADYERLVVTHSRHDGTVYVLRPPGADPHAILLAARLVLAQDRYEELAGHLGVPAHWPTE